MELVNATTGLDRPKAPVGEPDEPPVRVSGNRRAEPPELPTGRNSAAPADPTTSGAGGGGDNEVTVMTHSELLKAAESAVGEATSQKYDLVKRFESEIDAAKAAIRLRYQPEADALDKAIADAKRHLDEIKEQAPRHKWEWRKVERKEKIYQRFSSAVLRTETVYGIVETRTRETKFADNLSSYRLPEIGVAFVRLLKKDGKPGLKFESINHGWDSHTRWKLSEES